LPDGLSVNTATGLISGTPTGPGVFSIPFSATNGGGTANATLTLSVGNAPAPALPEFTSGAALRGLVGSPLTYTLTASNSPTSFGATGLPAGSRLTHLLGRSPASRRSRGRRVWPFPPRIRPVQLKPFSPSIFQLHRSSLR
jgi:hypothetical protein